MAAQKVVAFADLVDEASRPRLCGVPVAVGGVIHKRALRSDNKTSPFLSIILLPVLVLSLSWQTIAFQQETDTHIHTRERRVGFPRTVRSYRELAPRRGVSGREQEVEGDRAADFVTVDHRVYCLSAIHERSQPCESQSGCVC